MECHMSRGKIVGLELDQEIVGCPRVVLGFIWADDGGCDAIVDEGAHVMHVKCIHDLCTLPLDIPPYLHHILVIFMLLDDYWE
jgi:hypothetical protein